MFQYIEKLREKPDGTKKKVAFLIALSFSGLIFVVWLSVIYPNWREVKKKEERVAKIEPSPMEGFTANLSEGVSGIKNQIFKLKDSVAEFSSISTTTSTTTINQ